jgi:ribose transport system permease protein
MRILSNITKQREFMLLMIVVAIFVIMSFASPIFLNADNMLAVLLSLSLEGIIAVAMTMLLVSGGFDLSVGSVMALCAAVAAFLCKEVGLPVPLGMLLGVLTGAGVGLFNGLIVTKIGINPFITTLSGLNLFRGLTYIFLGGRNISGIPESYRILGQGYLFGIQFPIWYAIAIFIVGGILLKKSRFFRQNYYIGGNEKSAWLSGIKVNRIKLFTYFLTGLSAGFAGVVMSSRTASATTTIGTGVELRVITSVIVGGASLSGGEGTIFGTFLGCMLMALVSNVINLTGVDVYWQTFVSGAILLGAVIVDRLGKQRREKTAMIAEKGE